MIYNKYNLYKYNTRCERGKKRTIDWFDDEFDDVAVVVVAVELDADVDVPCDVAVDYWDDDWAYFERHDDVVD